MSNSRELSRRISSFQEIAAILSALKNLSLLEIRKLSRRIEGQGRMVGTIETVARDFRRFHPQVTEGGTANAEVVVLVGAERGFCGEFNSSLQRWLVEQGGRNAAVPRTLVAVGRKLGSLLRPLDGQILCLDGPMVVEQLDECMQALIEQLDGIRTLQGPVQLTLVHHLADTTGLMQTSVLPPAFNLTPNSGVCTADAPPILHESPKRFYRALVDHYVMAVLFRIFSLSLLVEHQRRVQHLQGAVHRLENRLEELVLRRNNYRREEITQELATILSSAEVT